jgi:heptaprenyl diphosphate synthase
MVTRVPGALPFLEPFRPEIEHIESLLCDVLDQVEEPLGPGLRRFLTGGKRLRPALVVLVGRLYGPLTPPLYSLAAAIEILHAATLIHDDVLDAAPLRRGQAALHVIWPIDAAVLAGDYLLGRAMALTAELAHPDTPEIVARLAEALCTVCAGEIRQTLRLPGERCGREAYYRHIEGKTASLCAVTAEMAGILADAPGQQVTALRHFGREVGIAYQIVDDVLDLSGEQAQLGKPPGNDLCRGLITLPVLYYLEGAGDHAPVEAVLRGTRGAQRVCAAVEAIRASGAVEAAQHEAREHMQHAQAALSSLPSGPARQALHALAGYVVERGC